MYQNLLGSIEHLASFILSAMNVEIIDFFFCWGGQSELNSFLTYGRFASMVKCHRVYLISGYYQSRINIIIV